MHRTAPPDDGLVDPARLVLALGVSIMFALHGARPPRCTLSPSGAVAAVFVGTVTAYPFQAMFIAPLIMFYVLGSAATRIGAQKKQKFELGRSPNGSGSRTAWQVLFTTLPALFVLGLRALWRSKIKTPVFAYEPYIGADAFALDSYQERVLCHMYLANYACSLGDTLASELGIIFGGEPVLITTFEKVPRGINGAVSGPGTIFSAIGGFIIGIVPAALNRDATWLLYGSFYGLLGSTIDSFLGATMQITYFDRISRKTAEIYTGGKDVIILGRDIISNRTVNLISCILTVSVSYLLAAANF